MEKMKRKSISKKTRQSVWEKYGKKCAYCGCDLAYSDLQVDHKSSVLYANFGNISKEALDNIENLMPSCRACNYYKSASGIEGFRKKLKNTLTHTCIDSFQARLAIKYNMIKINKWDGKFWFEKYNGENE